MKLFIGTLLLAFTTQQAVCQDIKFKTHAIEVTKIGTFEPNKIKEKVNLHIWATEAPAPGGESYRSALQAHKKRVEKKFPRKTTTHLNQRIKEENPEIIRKLQPEQGFSVISPIPGGTPSDNTLAISDNGFLMISWNTEIYAYDTNADTAMYNPGGFRPTISFTEMAHPVSLFAPFDPKLLYDRDNNRFVLVFLSGRGPTNSKIIVCFSSSENPTDPWHIYELDGAPQNNGTWTDYPQIAFTKDELFLTINLLYEGQPWQTGFAESIIWQMDKADGYAGNTNMQTTMWDGITYNNRPIRYLRPVPYYEGPKGPHMYFLSNRNYPPIADSLVFFNDTVILVEVTNTQASGNASLNIKVAKSNLAYVTPPDAKQPNGHTFDTNDGRMLGALEFDDELQYVASTMDTATGMPVIYHGFVSNFTTATPTITGQLITHNYLELGYPNFTWTGNQNNHKELIIAFNHTADTVNSGYSAVLYNGQTNTYSDIIQIKRGESFVNMMSGTYERWGDYFGIQRKYNEPGMVWTCGYWGQTNNQNSMAVAELKSPYTFFTSTNNKATESYKPVIYPNPVTGGVFTLEFNNPKTQKINVKLVDINGKLVKTLLKDNLKGGKHQANLLIQNITPATYFLVIESEVGLLKTEKVVFGN